MYNYLMTAALMVEEVDVPYFIRCMLACIGGHRLWLTPSVSGQPETLSCYDFEPTGTNDLRSLVAKVNRKLSRNQFKGLLAT